jgi:hypothetical protein
MIAHGICFVEQSNEFLGSRSIQMMRFTSSDNLLDRMLALHAGQPRIEACDYLTCYGKEASRNATVEPLKNDPVPGPAE